jgi:hypothetical protein
MLALAFSYITHTIVKKAVSEALKKLSLQIPRKQMAGKVDVIVILYNKDIITISSLF